MTQAMNGGEQTAVAPADPKWYQLRKKKELRDKERTNAFLEKLIKRGADVEALGRFIGYIGNQAKTTDSDFQKILKRKDFLHALETCGIEKERDYYIKVPKSRYATVLERTNPIHAEEMKELRKEVVERIKKGRFSELFLKGGNESTDIADMIIIVFSRLYGDEFFKHMIRSAVDAEARSDRKIKKGVELGKLAATLIIKNTCRTEDVEAGGEQLIPLEVAKKVEILGDIGKRYAIDYVKAEFDLLGDLVDENDRINASMVCEDALEDNESDLPYAEPDNETVRKFINRIEALKKKKTDLEQDEMTRTTEVRLDTALGKIEEKIKDKIQEADAELDDIKKDIENEFGKSSDNVQYEKYLGVSGKASDDFEKEAGISETVEPYEEKLSALLLGMVDDVKNKRYHFYEEKKGELEKEDETYVRPLHLAFKQGLKKLDRERFDEKTCMRYIDEQCLEFDDLVKLKEQMKTDEELAEEYKDVKKLIRKEDGGVVYYFEKYMDNLENITSEDIKNDIRRFEKVIPGDIDEKEIMAMEDKGVIEEDRKRIKNAAVCLIWMNRHLKDIQRTNIDGIKAIIHNKKPSMGEKILALKTFDIELELRMENNNKRYANIKDKMDITSEEEKLLNAALEGNNLAMLLDDRSESFKFVEFLGEKTALKILRTVFKVSADDIKDKNPKKQKKLAEKLQYKMDVALYRYEKKREMEVEYKNTDGSKTTKKLRTLKYDNISQLETDIRVAIEGEEKLKPEKKAQLLMFLRTVHLNEEKRLDIEIARTTAPVMNEPPYLFVNDYLAASRNYLGGRMSRDQFQDIGERKKGLHKMYYLTDLMEKSTGRIRDGLREFSMDIRPWRWLEGTKSFPTMRRGGKVALVYGIGGTFVALNLVSLLAGQPERPPLNHRGNVAGEYVKSLEWHASYPGGYIHDLFTTKKTAERLEGERYVSNEPTRVIWDGKKFYFEIDGEKKDLGEITMVTPGTWLNPGQNWETDKYGYYKSAYFGNSQAEPGSDVLTWIDNRPEVLRFLEEVGMKHKWVNEEVEREPEIAKGMMESGWQKKSTTDAGTIMLERWMLVPYEGDYVLNSEKTADFINYLKGEENDGKEITYKWLDENKESFKEKEYLIPRVMDRYMTTFRNDNLTTAEAKWILSDSGNGKIASNLLDELLKGKQINDKTFMLDEREIGKAIKKLYELEFSENSEIMEFSEENMLTVLKNEGCIGDSSTRPLVDRFGLSYANASWVSERPEILELLYHLKAERVTDADHNRYGIADANKFIDYLKDKNRTEVSGDNVNTALIGYSLPGYAANGYLKKVSDREYLGVTQDENWEWLQKHSDIKNVLEGLRTGIENEGKIYYLSPEHLQTDRLIQDLMDKEYQQNKNSKKEQNLTANYLDNRGTLEGYCGKEKGYLLLKKYNDYPGTGNPINGVKSNLGWMLHFGVQEPHANDVIYTPEIRGAFDEIYKGNEVYAAFKELYKSSDNKRVKAIWSKNYQLVFYEVGYYISNSNKDSGAGIECDGTTGQCSFTDSNAENNKKKLAAVTVSIITQMKQRKQLNENVTTAELEKFEEPAVESAKDALGDAQDAIDSAKAAGKDTSAAEEKLKEAQDAYDAGNYEVAANEAEAAEAAVTEGTTVSPPAAPEKGEESGEDESTGKKGKKGGKKTGGKKPAKKASSSGGAGGI